MFLVHFFSGEDVREGKLFPIAAVVLIIAIAVHVTVFSDDFSVDTSAGLNIVSSSPDTSMGFAFDCGCSGVVEREAIILNDTARVLAIEQANRSG